MAECPTCGDVFDSEHSMKSHHGAKHDSPVPEDGEYPCPSCHRAFETARGMRYHHYCIHGESLTKVTIPCEFCGDEVTDYEDVVEQKENVFCSRECQVEWRSENRPDLPFTRDGGTLHVECEVCGETVERDRCDVEEVEHIFCSTSCHGEWQSENLTGQDHPNWRGGYEPYYGPTWPQKRKSCLQRDDYECQDCGMSREEHYEYHSRDLEVHHIAPLRTFDDSADANSLSNLVTLCRGCHMKHEHVDELESHVTGMGIN